LVLTAPLGLPAVINGHWTLRPALAMLGLGAGGTAIATILTATPLVAWEQRRRQRRRS
jgi:hypothetical protein